MSLPRAHDWVEEVTYAELDETEAKAQVQKYNTQGREAGFGPPSHGNWKRFRDNRGPPRWNDRRKLIHISLLDFYFRAYDCTFPNISGSHIRGHQV